MSTYHRQNTQVLTLDIKQFLYLASVITVLIPLASRDVVTDGVAAKYVTAVHIMAVGSALNIVSLVLAKLAIVATLLRIVKNAHSQWEKRFLLSVGVLTVGFVLTAGFGFCYGTWRSTLDDDCVQRTGFWSYGIFSAGKCPGTYFCIELAFSPENSW